MPPTLVSRLTTPLAAALARQFAHPRGWFGRHVLTRMMNRRNRLLVEAVLDALPLGPETRLLDVGFGGGLLLELARRRGVRRLAGLDRSADAVARLRSPAWLDGGELRLELGSVEAMPFEAGAFDAVTTTNTVYFWPDLAAAFAELRRVLRPGGRLAVGFASPAELRALGAVTRHGFLLHEPAALLDAARAAGFSGAQVVDPGAALGGDLLLLATA